MRINPRSLLFFFFSSVMAAYPAQHRSPWRPEEEHIVTDTKAPFTFRQGAGSAFPRIRQMHRSAPPLRRPARLLRIASGGLWIAMGPAVPSKLCESLLLAPFFSAFYIGVPGCGRGVGPAYRRSRKPLLNSSDSSAPMISSSDKA
jgi:hypothetical protein